MSLPQQDIGWCCEEALIQILNQTPALLALKPTHADADTDTENIRITIKAERIMPEAPNPRSQQLNVRRVEMKVMIRASLGQMIAPDLYANYGIMCQVLENMDGPTYAAIPALLYFSYLVPTLNLENERDKDDNRRKMIKNITFLAILRNPVILP